MPASGPASACHPDWRRPGPTSPGRKHFPVLTEERGVGYSTTLPLERQLLAPGAAVWARLPWSSSCRPIPHTTGHRDGPPAPRPGLCRCALRCAPPPPEGRRGKRPRPPPHRRPAASEVPLAEPWATLERAVSPFNVGLTAKVRRGKHATKNVRMISGSIGGSFLLRMSTWGYAGKKMNR